MSTTYPGEIKIWDVVAGRERSGLEGVTGWIRSVAISPDARTLAAAIRTESGPRVILWESETWRVRGTLDTHGAFVHSLAFSPDGTSLAAGCNDGTTRIWDPSTEEATSLLAVLGRNQYFMRPSVQSIAFAPDGKLLAAGLGILGHNVQLLEVTTGRVRAVLERQEHKVTSVCFSPCGRFLAAGGDGRTITVWGMRADRQDKSGTST